MTRIDFYVLPDSEPTSRLRLACKLTLKAWQNDMSVYLRCQDPAQADALDELLWQYPPERFIPHERLDQDNRAPVLIGLAPWPERTDDGCVLINLALAPCEQPGRFARVLEIVNQHAELRARSRDNFRLYRSRGYDPRTETIKSPP